MKEMKANFFTGSDLEAEAICSKKPLSFLGGVNSENGEIIDSENELYGQSLKGKILVYPFGKGSTGDCMRLWRTCYNGVGPVAIINSYPDPIHVEGALLAQIPILFGFNEDPVDLIRTGDRIKIQNGVVFIQRGFGLTHKNPDNEGGA
ncbi:hypothetical protein SDC9_114303 [bioreactor metagenome]|uniref:Phosphomevalonate dehydratase small subunit-like domain-containing protein n=1 Tax=bioreactor metagenome TaxID=1076179 RepID=A0A645BRZ0_9ZZZZ